MILISLLSLGESSQFDSVLIFFINLRFTFLFVSETVVLKMSEYQKLDNSVVVESNIASSQ